MTDISMEDRDLIDRYLARRLAEREALVVETRMVEDPAFRNEVELTAALRDGLRELQRRGELTALLAQRRSPWRHPRFALAASLAALALGLGSFLLYQRLESGRHEVVLASLRFEHTRGAGDGPDAVWQPTGAPTRLQMQFDVGLEPATAYRVMIARMMDGAAVAILETPAVLAPDGTAEITADSALFEAGDYEITLTPQPPATSPEPIVYALRIAGQR